MTPYDFLELENQDPRYFRSYEDLPTCAACCQARRLWSDNSP